MQSNLTHQTTEEAGIAMILYLGKISQAQCRTWKHVNARSQKAPRGSPRGRILNNFSRVTKREILWNILGTGSLCTLKEEEAHTLVWIIRLKSPAQLQYTGMWLSFTPLHFTHIWRAKGLRLR